MPIKIKPDQEELSVKAKAEEAEEAAAEEEKLLLGCI